MGCKSKKVISDVRMLFLAQPDGEKLIKLIIENKNVVAEVDLLVDLLNVFRDPFNGSDVQERKVGIGEKELGEKEKFFFAPDANNWATMTVEI